MSTDLKGTFSIKASEIVLKWPTGLPGHFETAKLYRYLSGFENAMAVCE